MRRVGRKAGGPRAPRWPGRPPTLIRNCGVLRNFTTSTAASWNFFRPSSVAGFFCQARVACLPGVSPRRVPPVVGPRPRFLG